MLGPFGGRAYFSRQARTMNNQDNQCVTRQETTTWTHRLDCQDKKLDSLLSKFDGVVRIEERQVALVNRVDLGDAKIHKHANLLMILEHKSTLNTKAAKNTERFFWIAVAAALSLAVFMLKENIYHSVV
jgi:hypothetical protein